MLKRAGASLASAALSVVLAAALTGCGGGTGSSGPGGTATDGDGSGERSGVQVLASFYPLQYTAQRVVGDLGEVASLTKPGAEPHDLELSARDVTALADADLLIYLSGFQPAVDEAISAQPPKSTLDVAGPAKLDLTFTPIEGGEQHADEANSIDPHFWLDPDRLAQVGDAVATELAKLHPEHAATFTANAATLRQDLTTLDGEFRAGLANCTSGILVTSHNAFGYLARRYGLTQRGITGLTPEQEPDPKTLGSVSRFVKDNQVRTIYYETLVSPRIAEVVATETGARTAALDPLEGLTQDSAGKDYLEVMRANLASLRTGQSCS